MLNAIQRDSSTTKYCKIAARTLHLPFFLAASIVLLPLSNLTAQVQSDTAITIETAGAAARLASQRSASVEASRSRADQAAARAGQERASLLPSLDVSLSDGQRTFNTAAFGIEFPTTPGQPPIFDPDGQVEGPVRNVDLRGRVVAPLLRPAALARHRSARMEHRAATSATEREAQSAALTGAIAFVRAVRASAMVAARQADSSLASELLSIARDQLSAGVGVALDVTRAEAQVADARAQLIAAHTIRDRARLELARSLGVSLATDVTTPDSLQLIAGAPAFNEGDITASLGRRADVRAADLAFEAAMGDVSAARAEALPTIDVFLDDGQTGLDYGRLLNTYNYGVQISLPLFHGFRQRSHVEEEQAVARELDLRRNDLRQQVELEIRSAFLELRAAAEKVAATREQLRLAQQEVEQARERFRAGVSGNADIVSASLRLTNARTQLIDALAAQHFARIALAAATGDVLALP